MESYRLGCSKKGIRDMNEKELVIRESIHGSFFYHVAEGNIPLCGNKSTMYTKIPITCWGLRTHLNERYCPECDKRFNTKKWLADFSEVAAETQKPFNKIIRFLQKLWKKKD